MLKNIRHIFTDLDGTLLDDKGEPGAESRKLLAGLMEQGVVVSIVTGRVHSAVIKLAEELALNGYIISLDGALIKYIPDGSVVYKSNLKTRHVKKAIRLAEENLVNIVLCHGEAICYTEHNSVIPSLLSKYGASYTLVDSYKDYVDGTMEIVCSGDIKDSVKKIEEKFKFPYSRGCDTSYFRSKKNENIFYLEIRKFGSSKGKAVSRVLRHTSVKASQAAVIGDWYNDISMFQTKAVKVAVANAIPELHSAADIVTSKSNREDGAAEFFEMVLKSKRNSNAKN